MAEFESVKFENFERELKYLVGTSVTAEDVVNLFCRCGYVVTSVRKKEKNEIYYDDPYFSLIRSGEVIRASDYVSEQATGLMYKKNISDKTKPYVSKIEMGSTKAKTISELLDAFEIQLNHEVAPVMLAEMTRYVTIMEDERSKDKIYITFDHVTYALFGRPETKQQEKMLEIEDWNTPNSMDGDARCDACLISAARIVEGSDLPLQLIMDTKPYRGYLLLKNAGYIG